MSEASNEPAGVSTDVLCGVVEVLGKIHGRRVYGSPEALNAFLGALADVEQRWLALPPIKPGAATELAAMLKGNPPESHEREKAE